MGTLNHEQMTETSMRGRLKTRSVPEQRGVALDLVRCVTRGWWVVKMDANWSYVIIEWPLIPSS